MSKERQVIVAPASGFCSGVQLAIRHVKQALKKYPGRRVIVDGELVHNRFVCEDLYCQGAYVLDEKKRNPYGVGFEEIAPDDVVVIRAHGISLARREKIESLGCEIVDATCPLVRKIATIIASQRDRNILLLGDRQHEEVIGLRSYAPNVCVCGNLDEVREWIQIVHRRGKNVEKFGRFQIFSEWSLVCQSTLDIALFNSVKTYLEEQRFSIDIFDTICAATKLRQRGIEHIFLCDAAIVIGGKNSANTRRLYENICRNVNATWWIELVDEIDEIPLNKFHKIGIAAGASTSPEQIIALKNKIEKIA